MLQGHKDIVRDTNSSQIIYADDQFINQELMKINMQEIGVAD